MVVVALLGVFCYALLPLAGRFAPPFLDFALELLLLFVGRHGR
jgi:hypothetical protein